MHEKIIFQRTWRLCFCKKFFHTAIFSRRLASTHFGYQSVDEKEKADKVYAVFANVAQKYDLMNDVMSLGIHRLWKDYFVNKIAPDSNTKMLDMAGGTGDITFRALRKIQKGGGDGSVTVCDINQPMLDVGAKRAAVDPTVDKGRIKWVCANAEDLPFQDNEFDLYTIAFGIRNCTHVDKVLDEAFRVLKPGGQFACLEFSAISPILRPFYDFYSFRIIPWLGKLIANDYNSYRYLVESIRQFPDQKNFADAIQAAGFSNVNYQNLSFGICAIHSAMKSTMSVSK
ncbi:unnamed protein product [Enterobius vermicularis]|uniref:2-methoxy-6-polyprenyl-1,4-benzoquinol methylase, mitochondrial n=1 Tax=Enterobius vermicularis TaxID=51028 RepID=A0A0N4V1H3_ENTVE|nr:unnamed protein product [Enterobius vermicularis]